MLIDYKMRNKKNHKKKRWRNQEWLKQILSKLAHTYNFINRSKIEMIAKWPMLLW